MIGAAVEIPETETLAQREARLRLALEAVARAEDATVQDSLTRYGFDFAQLMLNANEKHSLLEHLKIRQTVLIDRVPNAINEIPDVRRAKLLVEHTHWVAERVDRQTYGPSIDVTLTTRPSVAGVLSRLATAGHTVDMIREAELVPMSNQMDSEPVPLLSKAGAQPEWAAFA